METQSVCRLLEWDSAFFGLRIATAGEAPRTRDEIDGALEWCREHSVDCLYLLVGAGDLATQRSAADRAFRLVDVRMTYEIELAHAREQRESVTTERSAGTSHGAKSTRRESSTHSATTTRSARESDIPALRAIAAASHTDSRFYADGRFPRERCDELYATWIEKSIRGWADVVLVAEHDGAPAAYISCHAREGEPGKIGKHGESGEIGLVGVDARAQGRGLGRALVNASLRWFAERGLERATVVTQGRNVAAQRLYQSAGFRTAAVGLWHHRWFDRASDSRP